MDLREEFGRIIREHGYPVLYAHVDPRVKCRCAYDSEPDPDCALCYGTGHAVRLARHFTWRRSVSVPESLVGVLRHEPPGWVHPDAWIYYFEFFVKPKVQDVIFEVGWAGNRVVSYEGRYLVTSVETMRQSADRVAYYRVVARAETKPLLKLFPEV